MVGITSNIPNFLNQVREIWEELSPNHSISPVIWLCVLIVVGILESLIKVYAAIAVGHQFHSHRLAGSILAFIGFGIVEMLLSFAANKLHLVPGGLFSNITLGSGAGLQSIQFAVLISVIGIAVYGTLCWYLLDRRLNLE